MRPQTQTPQPTRFRSPLAALLSGVALAALALPGCDSAACVFGPSGCFGSSGSGQVGVNSAVFPDPGQWIRDERPEIQVALPDTTDVNPGSPLVVIFSESMALETLGMAVSAASAPDAGGIPSAPIIFSPPRLLGDGRVMVLTPSTPMAPGDYEMRLNENVLVTDITGQELLRPAGDLIGSFSVVVDPQDEPRVVATYPQDAGTGESTISELVVVFDREVSAGSVTDASFDVLVDGAPPVNDPPATPLVLSSGLPDQRVYVYLSVDGTGARVPLGNSATVQVTLSPAGSPILDTDAVPDVLATTTFEFTTSSIDAPLSATIMSTPSDAIGIDNLTGPADLTIDVGLNGGLTDDQITIFTFGTRQVGPLEVPDLTVLQQQVTLTADIDIVPLLASDLDLISNASPPTGRLADGDVAFAFRLTRGNEVSPIQVLDVDPVVVGVQDAIQDLVAPNFTGFGTSGTELSTLRSDSRDLVVVGRADETLRAVEVVAMTSMGALDNLIGGQLPPVLGSDPTGLFVAAPVDLGLVSPSELPLDFTLRIFDRALNTSEVLPLPQFVQVGTSGPGNALPGGMVMVEVFDAATLLPVQDALVFAQEDNLGVISSIVGGDGLTDASGFIALPAAAVGETLVTVDAAGFDLFTFHGVPTDRLSVPLFVSALPNAEVSGTVTTPDSNVNNFGLLVADNRVPLPGPLLSRVGACSLDPFSNTFSCPYAALAVVPNLLGAQTFFASDPPATEFEYAPLSFLGAFSLAHPRAPAAAGLVQGATAEIFFLTSPEERAIDLFPVGLFPTVAASEAGVTGIDFANLVGDRPNVTLQMASPGLARPLTVGLGVVFDDLGSGMHPWRAAYPGLVDGIQDVPGDALGELVVGRVVDGDPLVRIEFVDQDPGLLTPLNRSGARPRLSTLPPAPGPVVIVPMNVPTVVAPSPEGPTSTLSFNLAFVNALTDARGQAGLYRVTLTDDLGRRWHLYRPDPGDAAGLNVVVHVPDLASVGGNSLASPGNLFCRVSAFGFPAGDFDPLEFLWSDIERAHDLFAHAAQVRFFYPN